MLFASIAWTIASDFCRLSYAVGTSSNCSAEMANFANFCAFVICAGSNAGA